MAVDPLTPIVRTVLGSDAPMPVLSPHPADAVLSCGALRETARRDLRRARSSGGVS